MEVIIKRTEVDRLRVIIACKEENNAVIKLKNYIENYDERLKGKSEDKIFYVNIFDILYVEAVDGKTFLYTEDNYFEVEQRLYELEEILDNKDFFRNSKSQIVNINKIDSLKPEINRSLTITLCNKERLTISRRFAKSFKETIGVLEGKSQ